MAQDRKGATPLELGRRHIGLAVVLTGATLALSAVPGLQHPEVATRLGQGLVSRARSRL